MDDQSLMRIFLVILVLLFQTSEGWEETSYKYVEVNIEENFLYTICITRYKPEFC